MMAPKKETRHADNERPGPAEAGVWGDTPDSASTLTERQAKRLGNIRASLALKGYAVVPLAGGLVISRWGMCRIVGSVDDLVEFARQVGVRP
jgi:hypothetical protein